MPRSREPFLWAMFSAGGMLAALLMPAIIFLLWVAGPLGWLETSGTAVLRDLVARPLARIGLFALIMLGVFHAAHRFRYTLYDGLQLYHLNTLIAVLTYGLATALTLLAGYVLLMFG